MLEQFKTIQSILANDGKDFEEALKLIKPKINLGNNPYYYPFLHNEIALTVNQIKQAKELFLELNGREARHFFDIGCGIGNVLLIAEILGLEVYGVDIIEEYIEVAKQVVPSALIEQGDILLTGFDSEFKVDIIYLFQPIANHDRMTIFLDNLLKFVPQGQIIIANFANVFPNFNSRVDFHTNELAVVRGE